MWCRLTCPDVYKRQVQAMLKARLHRCIDAEVGHDAADHHIFFALFRQIFQQTAFFFERTAYGLDAVSYTHLDVYKRQLDFLQTAVLKIQRLHRGMGTAQTCDLTPHEFALVQRGMIQFALCKSCLLYTSRCV